MRYNADFILEKGAALLGQTYSIPLGNALRSLQRVKTRQDEKNTVAAIGVSNLRDTVNVLNAAFGYRFLDADRLAYIRKDIAVRFYHDAVASAESVENALQKLYTKLEADISEPVSAQIALPCDALDKVDALLIFTEKTDDNNLWETKNAEFDFAFIAVNALRALNIGEKAFLDKIAAPVIGGERLAIAVANSDSISEDDYELLRAHITAALCGGFNILPDVLYDSDDELYAFWEQELIPEINYYYEAACNQILAICADRISDTLSEAKKLIDVDSKQIDEAIKALKSKEDDVRSKSEALCRMAQVFISGNVKSPLLNAMREYNENLVTNIFNGLNNVQNVNEAVDKIPDFVSTAWKHFFNEQLPCINDMFDDEAERIKKQIEADAQDVFASANAAVLGAPLDGDFTQLLINPFNLIYATPAEHVTLSKVSSLLLVGSIPLAFVSLPAAVVSAACAFGVKRFQRKSQSQSTIGADAKREIELYSNEICEELIVEVVSKFDEAASALKNTIYEAYKKLLDTGIASLNALRSSSSEIAEKRQFILDFEQEFSVNNWEEN